jgi:DNA-binding CsgD family transcriptional regulator
MAARVENSLDGLKRPAAVPVAVYEDERPHSHTVMERPGARTGGGTSLQELRIGVMGDDDRCLASGLAAAVEQGRCAAVVLQGPVGSGRTRMITALAAELRARGFDTRELRGSRAESTLPFGAITDLVPQFDVVDGEPLVICKRLIVALRALGRPVALCIDDADLIDESSFQVLAFAARRVPSVLAVSARNADRISDSLPEAATTVLGRLPDATIRQLVDAAASGEPSAEVRAHIVGLAEGNPGAATDLAASLTADQLAGIVPIVPLHPTPTLRARFLAPLLTDREQRTVALLLACEPGASMALLLRAAATLDVVPSTIDLLEVGGHIHERVGRLYLTPGAAGAALYSVALASERVAAHHALALASDQGSHRRVWHFAQAATDPDDALASELERSTEPAFRRGGVVAVSEIMQRAAALSSDSTERGRRLAGAAEAAWLAGNPERARALLFTAQEQSAALPLRTEVAYLRGSIELASGSVDYAMTVLRNAAAERLGSSMPKESATPLLIRAMDAAMAANDVPQAMAIGRMTEPLIDDEDLVTGQRAASIVGTARILADDLTGLRLTEPVTLNTVTDAEQRLALVAMRTALIGGDVRRLAALAAAAADRLRESGSVGQLPFVTARQGLAEVLLGRLDNAASIATEGVERSVVLGQHNSEAEHLAVLTLARARRGEGDSAVATAERALRLATTHGLAWPAAISSWALGELELSSGGVSEALARLETLWRGHSRNRHPLVAVFAAPELVEAAIRLGAPERGDMAFSRLQRWAEATGHAWTAALVQRCMCLRADGPEAAHEAFGRALAHHAEADRPFDLARTHLAYGERLRRERRRAECRQHLRFALEGFENVGASAWLERARDELRASGETLRRRDGETVVDELTPRERTIAQLVAEGRSNRDVAEQLFVSVRTVEFHLRNVFSKLRVSSRVELVGFSDAFVDAPREATQAALRQR